MNPARHSFFLLLALLSIFILLLPVSAFSKPSLNDRLVLMWQVQKNVPDEDLKLLKEKGINLVQSFPLINWTDEEIKAYLDRMNKQGFGVIMTIVSLSKKYNDTWSFDKEKASAFINKWKDHPAVFAWHAFDEPSNPSKEIPASFQEEVYRFIKNLDPKGQVFISWNGVSGKHYRCCFSEKAFDIFDLHAYVVDYPGFRQRKLINTFIEHKTRNYPVITTISAHNIQRRPELPADGVKKQYEFFFKQNNVTRNIGFYGWKLSPNIGIKDDPDLMRQFKELKINGM